jgi:hypothetical protein
MSADEFMQEHLDQLMQVVSGKSLHLRFDEMHDQSREDLGHYSQDATWHIPMNVRIVIVRTSLHPIFGLGATDDEIKQMATDITMKRLPVLDGAGNYAAVLVYAPDRALALTASGEIVVLDNSSEAFKQAVQQRLEMPTQSEDE